MKNVILSIAIISILLTSSCKKDYTCKCYLKLPYYQSTVFDRDSIIRSTRKTADKYCASYDIKTPTSPDSMYCYAYTNQ